MYESKEIRFIDSHYTELFRIPDGGYITVTRPDGEQRIQECKYIDPTHCEIGKQIFHICQFAERMEDIGAKVEPEPNPQVVEGYRVLARVPVNNQVFALAHNPKAPQPYVTWQRHKNNDYYCNGHYFSEKPDAEFDLVRRVYAERTDTPYRPPTEKKNKDRSDR